MGFPAVYTYPDEYADIFCNFTNRCLIKKVNGDWRTHKKAVNPGLIKGHLQGNFWVACKSKWYPAFCTIDIDHKEKNVVDEIRDALGLSDSNSMLFSSPSPDSYHLMFRPVVGDNPPTVNRLQNQLRQFGRDKGVEIYPQRNRGIRLPMGRDQRPLDDRYLYLSDVNSFLYWFGKCDETDISNLPGVQGELSFTERKKPNDLINIDDIFTEGLTAFSTRHDTQFAILSYLYRRNMHAADAVAYTWDWLKRNHNGFSKEYLKNPKQVFKHIQRQAKWIWSNNDQQRIYPDSTTNLGGWATKADIKLAFQAAGGSLPKARFFFEMIKYCNPRFQRNQIAIHSDRLKSWSSQKNYTKYIEYFTEKGLIERGSEYCYRQGEEHVSKRITPKWKQTGTFDDAVKFDGRAIQSLESAIRLVYPDRRSVRDMIHASGANRSTAYMSAAAIFDPDSPKGIERQKRGSF